MSFPYCRYSEQTRQTCTEERHRGWFRYCIQSGGAVISHCQKYQGPQNSLAQDCQKTGALWS
jgi:hypothetical protein